MQIETVTYLKKHANNLDVKDGLVVTVNGKPCYVVQSYDAYQAQQDSIALLKLLALSEKSLQQGEALTLHEAFGDDD